MAKLFGFKSYLPTKEPEKKMRSAAMGFIFITITIDVIGLGLIIPVMPKLIATLKNVSISEASIWGGYLITAYALMQFLFSPLMGNLSDRYGRRPVILISLLGFCADYLILAFASNYALFIVGRVLSGITGASFTAATAYVADISTDKNRTKNFGLIGAAFGLGFIIGPALGGLFATWGVKAPFYAAAGMCLLNFLYGYFVLPESLKPEYRRPFSWAKANPVGSFRLFKKNPIVVGLLLCCFFVFIAEHAVQTNWSFFTMVQFEWTEREIGISLAVLGAMVAGVRGGLLRYTNPWLDNEKSVYIGLLFYALGMTLFAFASQAWMMYVFLIPYCLSGIAGPALQAIVSEQVSPSEQGALQGVFNSVMSLGSILGPLLMTQIFYYFSRGKVPIHFRGAPFILGALLMLSSVLLAYYFLNYRKRRS